MARRTGEAPFPQPEDDKPPAEVRGGNRPSDYIPDWNDLGGTEADGEFTGYFEKDGCPGHDEDDEFSDS